MKNNRLSTKRSNSTMLLCATAVAALATTGCADEAGGTQADAIDEGSTAALQAPAGQTSLRDPNGTYFADVFANGTGCPPGSWTTSISPDGKVFTTTFSEYLAEVDSSAGYSVKDCLISIKLHSPAGTSYSVQQFSYAGYAYLDEGVKARQTASYYFQGVPVGAKENRTELVGPKDESYLFTDEVKTFDQVWSPCGKERDLQIATRVRIENGDPRGDGYINLSAIDGRTENKLVLKLGIRKCDADSTGGSTTNPGGSTTNPGGSTTNPGGSTTIPVIPRPPITRPGSGGGPIIIGNGGGPVIIGGIGRN